jgi:hypothetical protein
VAESERSYDRQVHALLARLDERVHALQNDHSELRGELKSGYVRLERYIRVEIAVFGLIGIVLTALIGYAMIKIIGQSV